MSARKKASPPAHSALSRGDSSAGTHQAAIRVFSDFQSQRGEKTFPELQELAKSRTLDYVDHDNIIIIMADFAKYLSDTPVRKKNTNKEEYLGLETIKKYFGYVKVELKELFPKLEAWTAPADHDPRDTRVSPASRKCW